MTTERERRMAIKRELQQLDILPVILALVQEVNDLRENAGMPQSPRDPLKDVLVRAEKARESIVEAVPTVDEILAKAPADLQAIFDEYRRENEPFGATQRRIASDWQALATRFGDDGAALDPLTPAERIKMHNLGRAVDWGKTRIIEVIGA